MSSVSILFDESRWLEIIQKPDWYFEYVKFVDQAKKTLGQETAEIKDLNKQVRHFFEDSLTAGKVALGSSGLDWDTGRQPIDTIVIHHTSAEPGYGLSYMNAVQLLNVYASYFANPFDERGRSVKGQPIWSNHIQDSKQVFYVYHWLMRMDGSFERLLNDDQIGWHAGNWEVNKRSVAICLDNDYENQDPTNEVLQKLATHIKQNYPGIKSSNIIGHSEARSGTICPGTNYLAVWKPKLLEYLANGS